MIVVYFQNDCKNMKFLGKKKDQTNALSKDFFFYYSNFSDPKDFVKLRG